jgi:prepilin signal peptidase PulO-like enzyme (type II secretory pathway)
MLNLLFAVFGLLFGGLINVLADDLPARLRLRLPHCPSCGHVHRPGSWLAISRQIQGGCCSNCELPTRRRALMVEIGTALIFAVMPSLIDPVSDLIIYAMYVAVLILIFVIDVEHKLVLHVITFPVTVMSLLATLVLTDITLLQSLVGAVAGFLFFYIAFLIGGRLFGPGALGFGDVTLSMTMGAMLGFQRIFFALIAGILFAGVWSIVGLLTGKIGRRSYFAYGPFLATGGLIMIVWGNQVYDWLIAV